MKTPRVSDFDPDAKVPTLKSPLEGMPTIGKPPKPTPQDSPTAPIVALEERIEKQQITDRATARPGDEPANRPPDRVTNRRLLVRRGFEWYEDQLTALKRLSLQEQL